MTKPLKTLRPANGNDDYAPEVLASASARVVKKRGRPPAEHPNGGQVSVTLRLLRQCYAALELAYTELAPGPARRAVIAVSADLVQRCGLAVTDPNLAVPRRKRGRPVLGYNIKWPDGTTEHFTDLQSVAERLEVKPRTLSVGLSRRHGTYRKLVWWGPFGGEAWVFCVKVGSESDMRNLA